MSGRLDLAYRKTEGDVSMRLDGKVAMVTGAASGIGRGITMGLVQAGASVSLIDVKRTLLLEVAEQVEMLGGRCLSTVADVSSACEMKMAVENTVDEWKRLDILVTSAGVSGRNLARRQVLEITEEDWNRALDINLKGTYLAAKYAGQAMIKAGNGGRIITIASTAGMRPSLQYAHYSASKAGVILLTKSLAVELGAHGITANAICPGVIQTPANSPFSEERTQTFLSKILVGRLGEPDDVAPLAVFLASEGAGYISGETILVDGGALTR